MRKLLTYLSILLFSFLFFFQSTNASDGSIHIEYFGRDKCGHCEDLKDFIDKIKPDYPDLNIKYYDLETKEGKEIFNQTAEKAGLSKTTPIIFVGDTFIQGFRSENTTGERIIQLIKKSLTKDTITIEEYLKKDESSEVESISGGSCSLNVDECGIDEDSSFIFDIPFIGTVNLKTLSLPFMSMILGLIDGFNPCAMWVLLMFIALLAQTGSKKRMFQIAGIFILAETIMYYLILNVWMTTWDFVGLDKWVTPIVGLVAIGAGIFFLWEWKTSDGTCKVVSHEKRKKTTERVQSIVNNPWTWATFIAVIGLALSVNIIEFACSIGIPQAFTKVLDLNIPSWIGKQWYMFLYILFYMLDDFIVFGIAIYSFEKLGVMTKYSRYANFLGGLLMLIIGILMLLKPEWLIF